MFNISIDGCSYSKNLEDFDSIRSVLLYRSVRLNTIQLWHKYLDIIYILFILLIKLLVFLFSFFFFFWLEAVCQKFAEYRRRFKNLVQVCKEVEKGDQRKESANVHVWIKKREQIQRNYVFWGVISDLRWDVSNIIIVCYISTCLY